MLTTAITTFLSFLNTAKYYLFGIGASGLLLYISFLKADIAILQAKNTNLNSDRLRYETALEIANKQVKEKIVYVNKEVEVIKWKTKTKIETIKEYVKDENKSDCENALNFARSYF